MPSVDHYFDEIYDLVCGEFNTHTDSNSIRVKLRQHLVDLADHSAAHRDQIVEGLLASDRNVEVNACDPEDESLDGCEFARVRIMATRCGHPDGGRRVVEPEGANTPPDWCPLRTQPVRITLKDGS